MTSEAPPNGIPPRNKGGRPRGSGTTQIRRDAIFLALSVLGEIGVVPRPDNAPVTRLATLIADDSDAEISIEAKGLMASFTPPPNLSASKLQHWAKYTAQRVNNTVKGKGWTPAELGSLQICSEAIVLMFLAPMQHAVGILAQPLAQEGWPNAIISRLAVLATLWGARRPGYMVPTADAVQALAAFLKTAKQYTSP